MENPYKVYMEIPYATTHRKSLGNCIWKFFAQLHMEIPYATIYENSLRN